MIKIIYIPLLALLAMLSGCTPEVQLLENDTPEQYGKSLVAALRAQEPVIFEQLIPSKEDIIQNVSNRVANIEYREEMLEGLTDERYGIYKTQLITQYNKCLQDGRTFGIDWAKVEFIQLNYEVIPDEFFRGNYR